MSNAKPAEDPAAEIARLTAELETLRGRAGAALGRAGKEAGKLAEDARDLARHETEALARQVQERPLLALAIAGAVGFLIGRLAR
jgi:ElaB/YqjD/DUF883 family membrane-anchored ribosome-binding protein